MDYQYSIDDLASKCQVSKQSIYNLISKNKDFVKDNSRKQQRKIKYNQAVLDLLLDYYGTEATEQEQQPLNKSGTETTTNSPTDEKDALIAALQAEIEALKKQLQDTDTLKQQLQEKEAMVKELLTQNGALILTIQQQQQERMALLPAPKKSIGERIKSIFGKS